MANMIAVVLSGYLGTTRVCKVTLGRFHSCAEADRFFQLIRDAGTDKTDKLKTDLDRFFGTCLVFCVQKEEQEGLL